MSALQKNKTWVLVLKDDFEKVIDCKWVFKVKLKSNGSLKRYKAQLVTKGFHQTPKIYFSKTFSLVVKSITISIVLTLVLWLQ